MFLKSQSLFRGFLAKNLYSGIRNSQNASNRTIQRASYVTSVSVAKDAKIFDATTELDRKKKMNYAAKVFLERAKEYDEMLQEANHEYRIGMRHLANMMGADPETFTQADADAAIEYLFPSGIYDKKARPIMKPPEEVFPTRKRPQFDRTGRPFHYLYYAVFPNYYDVCHQAAGHMRDLNKFEDMENQSNKTPDPQLMLDLSSSKWVTKDDFEALLIEPVADKRYTDFITVMERLLAHPYSYRSKDFIMKYRRGLGITKIGHDIIKPKKQDDGRSYVTIYDCRRKNARANVTVISPGTGLININGRDISFFRQISAREQLLFPLHFTEMVDKVDIVAKVHGGGFTGQSGAIRWGIAMGLKSFVDEETIERMRVAGLLLKDIRTRERKKPGQEGARRKFTWKKR